MNTRLLDNKVLRYTTGLCTVFGWCITHRTYSPVFYSFDNRCYSVLYSFGSSSNVLGHPSCQEME